jgi:hypothetical protein
MRVGKLSYGVRRSGKEVGERHVTVLEAEAGLQL